MQRKPAAANSKPSLPPEKYAGVYNDAWYGPITIRAEKAGLVISFDRTPGMIGDLQHWQSSSLPRENRSIIGL
jgi:hypothetical protein